MKIFSERGGKRAGERGGERHKCRREARTRNRAGFLTRKELAERLGVHPGSVSRWERDGCPVAAKGNRRAPTLFSLVRVETWLRAKASAQQTNGFLSLEAARTAQAEADANLKRQLLATRAKELLAGRRGAGLGQGDRRRPQSFLAVPVQWADRVHRVAIKGARRPSRR